MNRKVTIILLSIVLTGCVTVDADQIKQWEDWKVARIQELMSPDGFMNLAGLYWLKSGLLTAGSLPESNIVMPDDWPPESGNLVMENDEVWFRNIHSEIMIDSVYQENYMLFSPKTGLKGKITYKTYIGYLIERAGSFAIRLKNLDHPNLKKYPDINYFEFNADLQIVARFEPYMFPKTIRIENVLGQVFDQEIPGHLKFEVNGKPYTLEPISEGNNWFIIFSDLTSAKETYGSGRYLYAKQTQNGEPVLLDFNQAFNPPCAFTPFATCFLPPPENFLSFRIEAGELDFHFKSLN